MLPSRCGPSVATVPRLAPARGGDREDKKTEAPRSATPQDQPVEFGLHQGIETEGASTLGLLARAVKVRRPKQGHSSHPWWAVGPWPALVARTMLRAECRKSD
jgi:hypothetical protein